MLLKIFVSSNDALVLYELHKTTPIVDSLQNCTLRQKYFLSLMAVEDINFRNGLEQKLIGIAKGVGIEFKETTTDRRQSQGFRGRLKEKQRRMKNG